MIERLANVTYWVGILFAVGFVVGGLTTPFWLPTKEYALQALGVYLLFALIAFGLGWAIRYILTGKRGLK